MSLPALAESCPVTTTSAIALPPETQLLRLDAGLALESGETLAPCTLAYRTWGRLNARRDNAVVVVHALSGSANLDAWWPDLLGTGCALDPDQHFIICLNLLGSCYGSSGPLSTAADGHHYGPRFPKVSPRDQAAAHQALITALGISRVAAVIGPSMGGMVALEWALLHPQAVASLVLVATTARHSPQSIALNETQRAAIRLDPAFRNGWYAPQEQPAQGLSLARQMAFIGYRSPACFDSRFGLDRDSEKTPADQRHEVIGYLAYQGEKFVRRFDANSYIRLTECMNAHDVGRGRGGVTAALQTLSQPCLVISIDSDHLYPVQEQVVLAQHLPNAQHLIVASLHGHDGFLLEGQTVNRHIADFLRAHEHSAAPLRKLAQ